MDYRKKLGRDGEQLAEKFLLSRGLQFLDSNFRTLDGEIDLIMRENSTIIFVEVKTRRFESVTAMEAVDDEKLEKIETVALEWLEQKKLQDFDWRIDLVIVRKKTIRWIKGI